MNKSAVTLSTGVTSTFSGSTVSSTLAEICSYLLLHYFLQQTILEKSNKLNSAPQCMKTLVLHLHDSNQKQRSIDEKSIKYKEEKFKRKIQKLRDEIAQYVGV